MGLQAHVGRDTLHQTATTSAEKGRSTAVIVVLRHLHHVVTAGELHA